MGTIPQFIAKNGRKTCYRCKLDKPVSAFYRYKKYVVCPYAPTCKECQRQDRRKRYKRADKAALKATSFNSRMLRDYGITGAQYYRLLLDQGGVCKICERPPGEKCRLSVDHCHRTKLVRGLLCRACNRGIGVFGDDPNRLAAALAYIKASLITP